MKLEYMILSMIIPGPSSPIKDIDVYLQPLIHELKELWENGWKHMMLILTKPFNCMKYYCGQSVIFQPMQRFLVGAQKEERPAKLVIIGHALNISSIVVRCVTWVIRCSYLLIIHFEEIINHLMVKRITDLHLLPAQAQKYWKSCMDK